MTSASLPSERFFGSSGKASEDDNILKKTPVPLSPEEAENDEIRALAARLAPTLVEAEELLESEVNSATNQNDSVSNRLFDDFDEEDDGIQREVMDLHAAGELLRQELDMASQFTDFFRFSVVSDPSDDEEAELNPDEEEISFPIVETPSKEDSTSPQCIEADVDEHQNESPEAQGLPPIRIPSNSNVPPASNDSPAPEHGAWTSPTGMRYSHSNHMQSLHLQPEQQAWYVVHLTHFLAAKAPTSHRHHQFLDDVVLEYCLAVTPSKLKRLVVGLVETKITQEYIPVRTLTIRIRPDVLCGAVMEAVCQALHNEYIGATIHKRQGGHVQAWIPGALVAQVGMGEEPLRYEPFVVDVQLVTMHRMDACDRRLVLRFYHPISDEDDDNVAQVLSSDDPAAADQMMLPEAVSVAPGLRLRECAALIQRMESPDRRRTVRLPNHNIRNIQSMKDAVSDHLLRKYRACPSVKQGGITLPSLNNEDFSVIQSSWRFVQMAWDELETRELAFSTLGESRFGAFPALPTLDVHYCSQLRRLSREAMVFQLLKSASGLEEYAREAEYACANMISLLKPTFEAYGLNEPPLPTPVPLTAYPLDFTPPQASCPPWGVKVQHALNEIQAWVAEGGSGSVAPGLLGEEESIQSFELAHKAVDSVLAAFQKQDDEEQSARLGRKNIQVMDRLAKMQAHQRMSIERLQHGASESEEAAKAANDFLAKAKVREVPLIKWSVVVGGYTGYLSISANHVMFAVKLIPIIGGNTVDVFPLQEVDFQVREGTPSLLNPLPTAVSVIQGGREVYSFRPTTGASRLKGFLDLLKHTRADDPLFVQPK